MPFPEEYSPRRGRREKDGNRQSLEALTYCGRIPVRVFDVLVILVTRILICSRQMIPRKSFVNM